MRALAILFFGLAAVALFTGTAYTTTDGSMTFGPADRTFMILSLVLVGAGFIALFFAQKSRKP